MRDRIRRFSAINEFFEATGFEKRTDIDDFFIFRFNELPNNSALRMPPYQKDFYQVSLILNAGEAMAATNEQSNKTLANTLYFLSPEHVFSWQRNVETTGYIVYFKVAFLNFFRGNFGNEFSFFSLSQQNFQKLMDGATAELAADLDKLYKEYYSTNPYRVQILRSFLLSPLFKCKSFQETEGVKNSPLSKKQALVFEFQNLVSNCFIKHKQVGEYADRLHISANALNQTVKEVTGKTAKELISEKIIQEAKKQLRYSTDDISQIAYSIGFEEPTHFIRFFRRQTLTTPNQYRMAQM